MSEERDRLRDALIGARLIERRLARAHAALAGLMPFTAERMGALSSEEEDLTDAFIKRFEQFVTTLQDDLFRGLAAVVGHASSGKLVSRRDYTEFMEKLGAIASARRFRGAAEIRNRLAHIYPTAPEIQARNINAAHAAVPALRVDLDRLAVSAASAGVTVS